MGRRGGSGSGMEMDTDPDPTTEGEDALSRAGADGLSAEQGQLNTGYEDPLKFPLPLAIYAFLLRLGVLASISGADDIDTAYDSDIIDADTYTKEVWLPLISERDFSFLVSVLPESIRSRVHFQHSPRRSESPPIVNASQLIDVLARLALEPSLTFEIMRRFRPLCAVLWGRWLEMLGLSKEGEWRDRELPEREGEREAVVKVYTSMVRIVGVLEDVFPFLACLLRHPMLSDVPLPPSTASQTDLAIPLLTFHSLLHHVPHLPGSFLTESNISYHGQSVPWAFPVKVEQIMKTHPHRGTRLLAWRILRRWYGLYAGTGESLREKWIWNKEGTTSTSQHGSETPSSFGPLPSYPAVSEEDFIEELGNFQGESIEADLVEGMCQTIKPGRSRLVKGGLEVLVRQQSVDVWVLPVVQTTLDHEERVNLSRISPIPAGWLTQEDQIIFKEADTLSIQDDDLPSAIENLEGVLLFREGYIPSVSIKSIAESSDQTTDSKSVELLRPLPEAFAITPSLSALIRSLALHLMSRHPVLITSPPSSGKSSTIMHIWSVLHSIPNSPSLQSTEKARKRGIVFINLADRSLDSKSLLGSLSSGPTAGKGEVGVFSFVEGPLTRALRQGRWVVLSSIDKATMEVLSVVKTLAERMKRASENSVGGAWNGTATEELGGVGIRVGAGAGRWVRAGKGFMLFATRSLESQNSRHADFFGAHFFNEIHLPSPTRGEVRQIVDRKYERLAKTCLVETLIDVWEGVSRLSRSGEGMQSNGGSDRKIEVRDLLKWCRRVEAHLPRDVVIHKIESNPALQEEVFIEASDVFLGPLQYSPSSVPGPSVGRPDKHSMVAKLVADGLGLSEERAEWIIRRRVPEISVPKMDDMDGPLLPTSKESWIKFGRAILHFHPKATHSSTPQRPYSMTKPSLIVLEKLAVSLKLSEPVLMVGETGTGKTAAVGHLAWLLGKKLLALNLSNQTEAGDLIGGFRPINQLEEAKRSASGLVNRFVELFGQTFSLSRNAEYVSQVRKAFEKKRWQRLAALWREAYRMATDRIQSDVPPSSSELPRKRRKLEESTRVKSDLSDRWQIFHSDVAEFSIRHVQKEGKSKMTFSFVEGPLAKAIRNGDWILLDEVNLASPETLESLSNLLRTPNSSLVLSEQGDLEPIPRHPEFRLFACMNPATDVGKRDLPPNLRSKFSEIWVPPPDEDREALLTIVQGYIEHCSVHDRGVILDIAQLYTAIKQLATTAQIADGSNHPPHFSMRTLARALTFAAEFAATFGLRRSLYEGFLMSFTMLLEPKSNLLVRDLLDQHIAAKAKNSKSLFSKIPLKPSSVNCIRFGPYWLETGDRELEEPQDYILTPSVQSKVLDLARAVLTRKVPVLIQGPTSAGKTSVIEYLAKRTGHRFVRINNHEHTDIQEYIGTYVSDSASGQLVFQEGVLVRSLRQGHWIVLDELNLAPTDVLEALNRLLDDNRELMIPETGEVVRPHPHFMLFATQNPAGLYGGRKLLSRAFRNRFLEMHFGDVPQDELETILCQRCKIAPSYAKKTVAVFVELQRRRQAGRVFEQKHAFATLRDLFRWGGRGAVGYQQLAEDGYMLLAERTRRIDDKAVVKDVIEAEMKVKIDEGKLYELSRLVDIGLPPAPPSAGLVWTNGMRRLFFLLAAAIHRNEPVLLVGDTGSGKTSVCHVLALALQRDLLTVGCHQNTEVSDLLGGQRPLRNRALLQEKLGTEAVRLLRDHKRDALILSENFDDLLVLIDALQKNAPEDEKTNIKTLGDRMRALTALFEWYDGPLVQAMIHGNIILLDEISLADDSVLERLNSVLEPSRSLVLAEKSGCDLEDIHIPAHEGFQILATMNPGGDFGKKELSPALRNRFTEIWVPTVEDHHDLLLIISQRWKSKNLSEFGPKILEFGLWLGHALGSKGLGIGLRDILAWVEFINVSEVHEKHLSPWPHPSKEDAFLHGALMTVVDGLGSLPLSSGFSKEALIRLRLSCWRKLESLVSATFASESISTEVKDNEAFFGIGPFGLPKGNHSSKLHDYSLLAPTTCLNGMRVLRASQLQKPILLEGSPGVGKTSLVTAIAAATRHELIRINLSDQTDLMDLLGCDLPVEGGNSGEFSWRDAPFLSALQKGQWVLLDEMNLASQSILEGLNSSLDHRGTVYIPELDRSFVRHPNFRIFAAQNPLGQGGGRKGLPKSFLDRFTIVHMEDLGSLDLQVIANAFHPEIDLSVLSKMIRFNYTVQKQTMEDHVFGMEGSPWEFNLRDILRWLSLLREAAGMDIFKGNPVEYVRLLYVQRFRTEKDRLSVSCLFQDIFGTVVNIFHRPWPSISPHFAQVGHCVFPRSDDLIGGAGGFDSAVLLQNYLQPLEALAKCIKMGWLAILTGTKSTGKTTLVRYLASLTGRRLREFSMNAEVDTSELLGSFEQADGTNAVSELIDEAIELAQAHLSTALGSTTCEHSHKVIMLLNALKHSLSKGDIAAVPAFVSENLNLLKAIPASLEMIKNLCDPISSAAGEKPHSARFEWVDGPLVQAMKRGDWLLVEDANLCSPSVLDRLNSLFEPGGCVQLAERGPVNGEIQIIYPHPDFRLVMTLDPRYGELSRAMRNRGIEIAMLHHFRSSAEDFSRIDHHLRHPSFRQFSQTIDSLVHAQASNNEAYKPTLDASLSHGLGSIAEATLKSVATALSIAYTTSSTLRDVVGRYVLSALAPSQHGLALRLLPFLRFPSSVNVELAIREVRRHHVTSEISTIKQGIARIRAIPFPLLDSQPIDLLQNPNLCENGIVAQEDLNRISSSLMRSLAALFMSPTIRKSSIQHELSARPASALSVWDKSLLVHCRKMRSDGLDEAVISLFPITLAIDRLATHLLTATLVNHGLLQAASDLQTLSYELVRTTRSSIHVDFSRLQYMLKWITAAMKVIPKEFEHSAYTLGQHMKPLESRLIITSGQAMTQIWQASLPPRAADSDLNHAMERLSGSANTTPGHQFESDLVELLLVATSVVGSALLPTPAQKLSILNAVDVIVQRLASDKKLPNQLSSDKHEMLISTADSAAYIVTELTALKMASTPQSISPSNTNSLLNLRNILKKRFILPLTSLIPIHHFSKWTPVASDPSHSSAHFGALIHWSENLALGIKFLGTEPAHMHTDLTKAVLLRAAVSLSSAEPPRLNELAIAHKSLSESADVQCKTAECEMYPRASGLRDILQSALRLVLSSACPGMSNLDRESFYSAPETLGKDWQPPVNEIAFRYLLDTIKQVQTVSASMESIGSGYVAFAMVLWQLYVPNIPLDPAIGLRAESEYLHSRMQQLSELMKVLCTAETKLTGNDGNAVVADISAEIDALSMRSQALGALPISRDGNPALLHGLHRELSSVQNQIMNEARMNGIVGDLKNTPYTAELEGRYLNLQRSIETVLHRIDVAYVDIKDITNPVRLSLCCAKIGAALVASSTRQRIRPPVPAAFASFVEELSSFPIVAHSKAVEIFDVPLSIKAGEYPVSPARTTLLQISALVNRLSNKSYLPSSDLEQLVHFYDRLHYLWSCDRQHEEAEASEAKSLYKSKVSDHAMAAEEEIEAAEFAEMFPSFDSDDDQHLTSSIKSNSATATKHIQPSDQIVLSDMHQTAFNSHGDDVHGSIASYYRDMRVSVVTSIVTHYFDDLDDVCDRASAVYRVGSLVRTTQVMAGKSNVQERDFYKEPDIHETTKAVPILRSLTDRLDELIDRWPDQMVLQQLKRHCEAILSLNSKVSIAQILTAMEQLLQRTEDWENYADREHSLNVHRASIINLIIDWRRLELASWSRLLSTVSTRFNESVADWWFRIYDLAVKEAPGVTGQGEVSSTYFKDLAGALDAFMTASSLGQFTARLCLILSFAKFTDALQQEHAKQHKSSITMKGAKSLSTVSRILLNIHGYYSQFSSKIIAHISHERGQIDRDVQAYIKLASWKDVNVFALRQSAIRSHHQLFKCVRKLRASLQKPASDFFVFSELLTMENTQLSNAGCILSDTVSVLPNELPDISPECFLPAHSSIAAPHTINLGSTLERFNNIVKCHIEPVLIDDRASLIEEISERIIGSSKELKAATLAGPAEGREQRIKSLTARKRLSWIELLRELKRLGLSQRPSPNVIHHLYDTEHVYSLSQLCPPRCIADPQLVSPISKQIEGADSYHYRILSELPRLRSHPVNAHQDIGKEEIRRAVASVQSSISMTFETRLRLGIAIEQHMRLNSLSTRISNVIFTDGYRPTLLIDEIAPSMLQQVFEVVNVFEEGVEALKMHQSASCSAVPRIDELITEMEDMTQKLSEDRTAVQCICDGLRIGPLLLSTNEEMAVLQSTREHLLFSFAAVKNCSYPTELNYIISPISAWCATINVPQVHSSKFSEGVDNETLHDIGERHTMIINLLLVIVQKLKSLGSGMQGKMLNSSMKDLPDNTLKTTSQTMIDFLDSFHLSEILTEVENLVRRAQTILLGPQAKVIITLLRRIQPFLATVIRLAGCQISAHLDWYKSMLKLSYVVSSVLSELASEGFCKPADEKPEDGDIGKEGKTSDGTGMADGSGAKNVSNEIEEESQIEGLEGDVEKQEKDENEQPEGDDDDAVEMSADFDGQMEDRGDGQQNDDNDEDRSDSESEPDPEEQIANVDPLDPSSVDEKFWGDENKNADEENDGARDEINQEISKESGESEMRAKDEKASSAPEKKNEVTNQEQDITNERLEEEIEAENQNGADTLEENTEQIPQAESDKTEHLDERMPEADNLDLPEDIQLDNNEEMGAEDLDLDDMGESEDIDHPDTREVESSGDAEDGPDSELEAVPNPEEAAETEAEDFETKPDEQQISDQSLGGAEDGEIGGEGVENNKEEAERSRTTEPATSEQSANSGNKQSHSVEANASAKDNEDRGQPDDDVNNATPPDSSSSSLANVGHKQTQSKHKEPALDTSSSEGSSRKDSADVQRSLGDTLQTWQRRLEAIADLDEPKDQQHEAADDQPMDTITTEAEVGYVEDGMEMDQDQQALGPATEEQVKGLQKLRIDEEDQVSAQPENSVVDSAPTKIETPFSMLQLNHSDGAEMGAKAITADELRQNERMVDTLNTKLDTSAENNNELLSQYSSDPAQSICDTDVEQAMLHWRREEDAAMTADVVWRMYDTLTRDLSYTLTEQLRLILEPTLATRLKGDYRSGKRLNMKKIIPYIASEFTKDKIWLRRTRPSQREYQVLIAIDDSKSMADSHSVHLAYQTLSLISQALTRLEVGGVSICRFGSTMEILHPFDGSTISDEAGAKLLSNFTFAQRTTDVRLLVEKSLEYLAIAKESSSGSNAAGDLWQLQIIISDGMCQDHDRLRTLLRKAADQKVMFVFLVLDSLHSRANGPDIDGSTPMANSADVDHSSILAMKSVSYTKSTNGVLELKMDRYLDSFPFEYFVILRNVEALPEVLSSTLRQFFESSSER